MAPCDAVLVFLRAPELGKVKTRLSKHIGEPAALELYACFIRQTLKTVATLGLPVCLYYDPPDQKPSLNQWLGASYDCQPQVAGNLGQKMAAAFTQAFSDGIKRAVLIGTDLPDLPEQFLQEAFCALDKNPAVIGPSADGGYYLIGFRAADYLPAVFDGIAWSTAKVFSQTLTVFRHHGKAAHTLPIWRDIDEYEDLIDFILRNPNNEISSSFRYLLKFEQPSH